MAQIELKKRSYFKNHFMKQCIYILKRLKKGRILNFKRNPKSEVHQIPYQTRYYMWYGYGDLSKWEKPIFETYIYIYIYIWKACLNAIISFKYLKQTLLVMDVLFKDIIVLEKKKKKNNNNSKKHAYYFLIDWDVKITIYRNKYYILNREKNKKSIFDLI